PQFPCVHPDCSLVARLRFDRTEEGHHSFRIGLIDGDGRNAGPWIEGDLTVQIRSGSHSVATNLIVSIKNLQLSKPGTFYVDLIVDNHVKTRIPLRVDSARLQ